MILAFRQRYAVDASVLTNWFVEHDEADRGQAEVGKQFEVLRNSISRGKS
jgi:hypothetical protein